MLESLDHQLQHWAMQLGWPLESFLRLVLAAIAGGLVGLERELRGRQAGFRTNILVCLGSALVMIVSVQFAVHPWVSQSPNLGININVDPARIAYGVMTGIGFLGAGTILQTKGSIRGLTTAAALWCVAAVGLAVGFGLYLLSILATLLIVGALWVLNYLEYVLPKVHHRSVIVRRKWEQGCIEQTINQFKTFKLDVIDASFERTKDLQDVDINLRIAFTNKQQYYTFEHHMEGDSSLQLIATREV